MVALTRRIFPLIIACMIPAAGWCIQLTVPLIEQAPVIDGHISAEEQGTAVSTDLTKVGGLDKPQYPTKVFASATLKGVYVGFIATEPQLDSVITSATRDNGPVFNDDSVQIFITPSISTAADEYYHFAVNPNGTKYSDHLITGDTVNGWSVAVSKGSNQWEAEFFIPLSSIDAPQELPIWRANFARVRPARNGQTEERSAWVNPGTSLHNYKRFGYMTMPRFVPPAPRTKADLKYTTEPVEIMTTATIVRHK